MVAIWIALMAVVVTFFFSFALGVAMGDYRAKVELYERQLGFDEEGEGL